MGGGWPLGWGEGAFDFDPLVGNAGLAALWEWGVAVAWPGAVGISGEGHGKPEQAVLDGFAGFESNGNLVRTGFGMDVEGASLRADLVNDIRPSGFPSAECHRNRGCCGDETVVGLLKNGTGGEANPVASGEWGGEAARGSDVWPTRGAEEGEFEGGVSCGGFEGVAFVFSSKLFRLVVSSEEH